MSRRTHMAGFTLAELLVATFLLVIVLTAVYTAFSATTRLWRLGEKEMTAFQNARIAGNLLREDLYGMMPYSWHLTEGDDNELGFFTITQPLDVELGSFPRVMWVHYELEDAEGPGKNLVRTEQAVEGPLPLKYPGTRVDDLDTERIDLGDEEEFVLANGIEDMTFRYTWVPRVEMEAPEEGAAWPDPVSFVYSDVIEEDYGKPQSIAVTLSVRDGRVEEGVTPFVFEVVLNDSPPTLDPEEAF